MKRDAHTALPPSRAPNARRFRIDPWSDDHFDAAQAASRFMHNIVQFPGCHFFPPASYVAFEVNTGAIAGMLLTSFVAAEVGPITELCRCARGQRCRTRIYNVTAISGNARCRGGETHQASL